VTADPGSRIGLALAGGGPEGAIYEIGALRALDEAVDGLDLNALDVYVGVSAGAFIAANLVNQLTTAQMCRAIVKHEPGEHPFLPETFLRPAFGELRRRCGAVPGLVREALLDWARNPGDVGLSGALLHLTRALPVGLLDNEPIREYLARIYSLKGRSDDFRQLDRRLIVVAAELETGEAVRFGDPGLDHVPVSLAVQASTALPGLYPPVEIDGRHYVDGVLLKTLHASVALDAGARLVLCINPLVPVDLHPEDAGGGSSGDSGGPAPGRLVDRGLPSVLSQTFRTLIHSRLQVGLASYGNRYRDADVVLIEPRRDDYRMFFTSIFTFSSRKAVCEHAYNATRRDLLARYDELSPILERHGLGLRRSVLEDAGRSMWRGVGVPEGGRRRSGARHTLDRLTADLDRLEALIG
jgi:predicted acylesterase/phospholipase RssA